MKFNFSVQLKDMNGEGIEAPRDRQDKLGKVLTLSSASVEALMYFNPSMPEHLMMSGKDKYRSFQLSKLVNRDSGELSAEEVVFLKEKIGSFWSPNVVGACYDLLENPPVLELAK